MKVKVCGMRQSENIRELVALRPDFIGFIFYEKSPRYVGGVLNEEVVKAIPRGISKVGVFVNASPDYILSVVKQYDLQYVQLHGSELPDFCRSIRQKGVNIIKAFLVDEHFNFAMLNNYKSYCDFFLFDTPGKHPGGNGQTFDWDILTRYDNEKPFFLSGGIGPENLTDVQALAKSLKIYAVDINSKFEVAPGEKNIEQIRSFIQEIRQEEERSE
jgi:phosphoribosylanthranilate isomerase